MSVSRLPEHLLKLLDTLDGFRHEHARAVVAFAADLLETSERHPGQANGPRTPADAASFRIGREEATKRVAAARKALARPRIVIMRLCGVEGRPFAEAARELRRQEVDVRREFLFACGDLLRCYRSFEEPRDVIVRFDAEDSFSRPGGGTVYTGPAPFGMERDRPSILGRIVSIGDRLYRVADVERTTQNSAIRQGESIGLLVKPLGGSVPV